MPAASTMESMNVKIDSEEKAEFAKNTKALGTTPSNAIRMFVRAFNARRGFPFDVSGPYAKHPLEMVDWSKVEHVNAPGDPLPAYMDDDSEDDGLYDELAKHL